MEENKGAKYVGGVTGIERATVENYGIEKFHGARGHGFSAERGNNLIDQFEGNDAQIAGDDNAKNGADRILNGTAIQSKYCKTGSKCIGECFKDGQFRYYNADGSPMQIEVPSDRYEDALRAMQDRIDKGQIKGVKEAKDVVKKGHLTYEQAKNIAKAGTVDSLAYDSAQGIITAGYAGGISAAVAFAQGLANGKSREEALQMAAKTGLQVGGVAFITSVVSSQLTKAGLNSLLVGSSDAVVAIMGPKASAALVNAFRSGGNIYGAAAMKSASKLLRSNAITGVVTTLVLSAGDISDIFQGRISFAQLFKNVTNTAAGVAGGVAGWGTGATAGAAIGSVVPVVGTAIGGFLGGLFGSFVGGSAANKVSKTVTDALIEDDSKEMLTILNREFSHVATDYLLVKAEVETLADKVQKRGSDTLKDMYAANNRSAYAYNFLSHDAEKILSARKRVSLPSSEEMLQEVNVLLEA